jgi:hypothetical protein
LVVGQNLLLFYYGKKSVEDKIYQKLLRAREGDL